MKKLLTAMLSLVLLAALFIPALAVTPSYKAPAIPKVPEIKVHVQLAEDFWDNYVKNYPISADWRA